MVAFEELARNLEWVDVNHPHWEAAATLWAECQKSGTPVNDADLLLAVQARYTQAVVVTDDNDFDSLGVSRENWIVR